MSKKITTLNNFKRKQINCPHCKSPSISPHTPFCSRRCARIDLGKWLNEDYAIPSDLDDEYIDSFHKLKQVDKNP